MTRNRIALGVIALACLVQTAAADPQTRQIRRLAVESNDALVSGNYSRVVELTYSKVVQMVGGRAKMIEMLQRDAEQMKASGSAILGAEMGEPGDVVDAGHKRFSIVPMTVRVRVPQGTLWTKSFLVAVSENDGTTWQFLDGAGLVKDPAKTKERLMQVLPDFPATLALPARDVPQLEPR